MRTRESLGTTTKYRKLNAAGVLAANTRPEQVYSYTHGGTVRYVVVTETETRFSPGRTRTLVTYWHVDITAPAAANGPDAGTAPEQLRIAAGIPGPVAYKHLHFGAGTRPATESVRPAG